MEQNLEELLIQMSWKDSKTEQIAAEQALNEFIQALDPYLKKLCQSQSKGRDVVFRDFYKLLLYDIWDKCDQFDDSRNKDDEPVIRVKKWIAFRMKAVIRDYWSRLTSSTQIVESGNKFEEPFDEETYFDEVEINESKFLLGFKSLLSEVEQDILRTHYEFNGYVPNEISEALCKEYDISESYRRVIKCRAMKKLKDFSAKKKSTLKLA